MIKVDLITGFLGSGKTTFLKMYAKYFIEKGEKVGILENDYGAVNVDMLLLNELRGENCELEMVAGACDRDCHMRRFKTKLIAMGMSGYDRVIIEPSGIFDIDEFFDTLRDEPLDRWYEIGSVIAIVDAGLEKNLSETSKYFLTSQVASAGTIMLSRTQLIDEVVMADTKRTLVEALSLDKVDRDISNFIVERDWASLTAEDYETISNSGYKSASFVKKVTGDANDYSTEYFLEVPFTRARIKKVTEELMENTEKFGKVFRVKGFFIEDGIWYEVNATRKDFYLEEIPVGQEVMIVIGEDLVRDAVRELVES